jgi:hypothetical protein
MIPKYLKRIYDDLGEKYGLLPGVIKIITDSPFLFIRERMLEKSKKDMMLPYFGRFKVKKKYEQMSEDEFARQTKNDAGCEAE